MAPKIYPHGTNFTNYCRLQVHKDGSGNMFASSSFTEEGVKGVISSSNSLITGHPTIRLDSMFQAVQLPACIAHLGAGLADVH